MILAALLFGPLPWVGEASAQENGRSLVIEDFYAVRIIASPAISPDGEWVAYSVVSRVEEDNSSSIEVWVMMPYGYDPSQGPYPLIVHSHGGPLSCAGDPCFQANSAFGGPPHKIGGRVPSPRQAHYLTVQRPGRIDVDAEVRQGRHRHVHY